ncbi:2OG-Fe(II) oxygenase [Comamonas sp. J-3]|uniref:2OG-Fe(II) oxygenase n=1 Tax=Comamonas trifloxystrobinivorans TaxID=3350256 RepID=UPI00372A9D0B
MTASQPITPELRAWIIEQASAGVSAQSVFKAMVDAGWNEDVAESAMEKVLTEHLQSVQGANTEIATQISRPLPEPALMDQPGSIDVGDRQVSVLLSMKHPRIVVFGNLLSDEECDAIIASAQPRMKRSLTVETKTGGEEVNADRTSDGMFFQREETPVVATLERRIAKLVNWPESHGEGLQVLHYRPGAEYKPHYDYFDPSQPGTPTILKRGGQRVATLVIYLNNPEAGGGTSFPDVGVEVAPRRGNAVFFSYATPEPSTKSLHGGSPVVRGEKWIATKWLREGEFK